MSMGRVMTAIEICRTAAIGGHVEQCDTCGHQRISYNSCRNRHCPKCQSLARAQWLEDRRAEILDTQYFHVVFTIPKEIAEIAFQNKKTVYGILFRTVAETLRTIATADREADAPALWPALGTHIAASGSDRVAVRGAGECGYRGRDRR